MVTAISTDAVWKELEKVKDPEIPVLSIVEMAMITNIVVAEDLITVTMTPTFVGCPAIDFIKKQIADTLSLAFDRQIAVVVDLTTRWNTDMLSDSAKEKLEKFGLAPPPVTEGEWTPEMLDKVRCPHCKSTDTTLRSAFGSTLCRAIRFCFNCKQGFEQFKPVS